MRRVKRQYGEKQNSSHQKRKKFTYELFQAKRSSSDAELDRSPEGFLPMVSG